MKITILLNDGKSGAYFFKDAEIDEKRKVFDAVGNLIDGSIALNITGELK